jgi:hypothetical protein
MRRIDMLHSRIWTQPAHFQLNAAKASPDHCAFVTAYTSLGYGRRVGGNIDRQPDTPFSQRAPEWLNDFDDSTVKYLLMHNTYRHTGSLSQATTIPVFPHVVSRLCIVATEAALPLSWGQHLGQPYARNSNHFTIYTGRADKP